MNTARIKDISPGTFFKKHPTSQKVYMREKYCRLNKRYQCTDCDDIWSNGAMLRGTNIVYVDFTY